MITPWTGNSLSLVNVISAVKLAEPALSSDLPSIATRQSKYDRPKSALYLVCILHPAFELYEFGSPLGLFPVGLPLDFGG